MKPRIRLRIAAGATFGTLLIVATAAPALAASNPSPSGTGQPSQSCLSATAPNTPGMTASSPGAPFNEPSDTSSGGVAGQHYAGQQPQNSKNTKSVSQYDVACYQVSQH